MAFQLDCKHFRTIFQILLRTDLFQCDVVLWAPYHLIFEAYLTSVPKIIGLRALEKILC